jgi:hypothetical protein
MREFQFEIENEQPSASVQTVDRQKKEEFCRFLSPDDRSVKIRIDAALEQQ